MKSLATNLLKSFFKLLIVLFLATSSVEAFFSDLSLPKVTGIKTVLDRNSVGFEWKSLANYPNVQGINIYRAKAVKGKNQVYIKIATVGNRFATHFVDTTAKPNTNYFYTFTTIAGLSESVHGDIVPVRTKPPYKAVKFVEAKLVDRGVVKLLWVPSSEPTITEYIIERHCRDKRWHFVNKIQGRLYPEYVDTTAPRGFTCSYRVFASDAVGLTSYVGKVLKVEVK
jgi:fibronectin type 3 domain-containing protein